MNLTGLLLGLFMLVIIGFGFIWVIKLEYYIGAHIWKAVLAGGIMVILISVLIPDFTFSALVGIFGGSIAWGATELPDQEVRARNGLFPVNPNRAKKDSQE